MRSIKVEKFMQKLGEGDTLTLAPWMWIAKLVWRSTARRARGAKLVWWSTARRAHGGRRALYGHVVGQWATHIESDRVL